MKLHEIINLNDEILNTGKGQISYETLLPYKNLEQRD